MNSGKVIISVLAGVAAGAVVGILIAPDKGSKTRKLILQKSENYLHDLKGIIDTSLITVINGIQKAYQEADELALEAINKYDETQKEFKNEIS
jgi:gas vesicle protein